MDPAAPYAETVELRPRYQPSKNLPAVNKSDVTAPPIHTSRHAIFTSGNTLKIIANNTVITANDNRSLPTTDSTPKLGIRPLTYLLNAASAALTMSETNNKKPIPTTIAND